MPKEILFSGRVTSGAGEGRHFMALQGYLDQFMRVLGLKPYPGTLNIKLTPESVPYLELLKHEKGIRVNGFAHDGKQFGGVSLFKASISGIGCTIAIPDKGRYTDVIEVVSDRNLRESMHLNDGDKIDLLVML
jgi:riboflavin kinase